MAAAQTKTSDIVMMNALELSAAIRAKRVSCVEVMTAYLDHIARLNPKVNADCRAAGPRRAIAQARERDAQARTRRISRLDARLPARGQRPAARQGHPMTMGSVLYKGFVPTTDAIFVERIRRAGAIIIGKTNTPEFGLGSNTYNEIYGTTLNSYDQTKTAGGSSGGASVALALRMLPSPTERLRRLAAQSAAYNNIFGLRPSYGRVPTEAATRSIRRSA
jgi:amidase